MSEPTDLNGPGWGQAPRYPGPGVEGQPADIAAPGVGPDAKPEFENPTGGPETTPGLVNPELGSNPTFRDGTPPVEPTSDPANQTWVPLEPNHPPQPQYGQYAPGMPPLSGAAPPPGQPYPGTYNPPPGQPYPGGYGPTPGQYPGATPPPPPDHGPQNYGPHGYGYVPPPVAAFKPGIIPLRPLGLGDIWDGAFKAIRYAPGVMFGLTAIIETVFGVIATVISVRAIGTSSSLVGDLLTSTDTWNSGTSLAFDLNGAVPWLISSLIVMALNYLALTILTGLLTFAVSRAVIGQKVTISQAWAEVSGQIGRLVLLSVTTVLIIAAAVVVPTVVIALVATSASGGLIGLVAVVMIFVIAFLATFLAVKLTLATPALVLERASVGQALRRAWHLSKGAFWRLLGITLLTGAVVGIASSTVASVGGAVAAVLSAPWVLTLTITSIITIATSTLFTPFQAGVTSLLYIDRRIRTEGLDIELARAAEG